MTVLLKYWQAIALVIAIGFGALFYHKHNVAERERGMAEERARVADSVLTANAVQLARVDTQLVHDTVTVRQAINRVRTYRDTVRANIHDTTVIKEFIVRDSIAADRCSELSASCAEFRQTAMARFAAYENKITALGLQSKRHWYDGRLAIGPGITVSPNGRSTVGLSVQLSIFRFP